MEGGASSLPPSTNRQVSEDRKMCWVCFASVEDDTSQLWVRPCRCRGSSKWVHQVCLQRWIDEKQKGDSTQAVTCAQCNTEYIILLPKMSSLLSIMHLVDKFICKGCPFVAGGIFISSVYWTAVTYGAVTVMQVLGHNEGVCMMEKAEPLFLLVGLPAIPIILLLGKMIRWEDHLLRFCRKHYAKIPIIKTLFPSACGHRQPTEIVPPTDPISATRVLCGAMILPTIATIVGKLMFGGVTSNIQRTLLGGAAFITIKGVFKIYYKQQQYLRQAHRQVMNFEEPEQPAPPAEPQPLQPPPVEAPRRPEAGSQTDGDF